MRICCVVGDAGDAGLTFLLVPPLRNRRKDAWVENADAVVNFQVCCLLLLLFDLSPDLFDFVLFFTQFSGESVFVQREALELESQVFRGHTRGRVGVVCEKVLDTSAKDASKG